MVLDKLYPLPAGHTLTVTVGSGIAHVQQLETASVKASVSTSQVFGPYALDRTFRVQDGGNVTVAIAEADTALSTANAALIAAIPTATQHDSVSVYNDTGVLKVSGA
jgi:hypothetical protein